MANDQHEQNIRQMTDALIAHLRGDEDAVRLSEADRLSEELLAQAAEKGVDVQAMLHNEDARREQAGAQQQHRTADLNGRNRAVSRAEAERLLQTPEPAFVEDSPPTKDREETLGDTKEFPALGAHIPAEAPAEDVAEPVADPQAPETTQIMLPAPPPKAVKRGFSLFRRRKAAPLLAQPPAEDVIPEAVQAKTVALPAENTAQTATPMPAAEETVPVAEPPAAAPLNGQPAGPEEPTSDAQTEEEPTQRPDTQSTAPTQATSIEAPAKQVPDEYPAEQPAEQILTKPEEPSFLRRLLRRLFPPRLIAFAVMFLILFAPLYAFFYTNAAICTVICDGKVERLLFTARHDTESVRSLSLLDLQTEDEVTVTQNDDIISLFRTITIRRAFPVTVMADGAETVVYVLDETASEAAAKAGVQLSEHDYLTPEGDAPLQAGDAVTVSRVTYVERTENEIIPWQEVTKPSPLLADGRTRVMNAGGGRDGLSLTTYADRYVNGVFEKTEVVAQDYIDFPWNVVTLEGNSDAICSSIDGSQFTDVEIVDNAPTEYKWMIEQGACTAYSYKPGVWGASGMYLFQGCVAVDPDVIPFGSLLYITSPDGSFVYGWAIAADAGQAMMEGRVSIDCFFETYNESCLFGRKYLNIYIVDQLTQGQLEQYAAKDGYFRARIPAA